MKKTHGFWDEKIGRGLLFSIAALLCVAVMLFSNGYVYSFFSGLAQMSTEFYSGSVRPVIENLQISHDDFFWTSDNLLPNSGQLGANTIVDFSFFVRNAGRSVIDFNMGIELVFNDGSPSETGVLFLFPAEFPDEEILAAAQTGDFSGALMGVDSTEAGLVLTSNGNFSPGIKKMLATGRLLQEGPGTAYGFKLFFFAPDEIVAADPAAYQNKTLTVNITVQADLAGRETAWATATLRQFDLSTRIADYFPMLEEVSQPKVYFIGQTSLINLAAYARASDVVDGDLTYAIQINAEGFDPTKAGSYKIIYNVKNSAGNYAAPLEITIVVWDFVKIASGYYHTLALTSHGQVWAWGYNAFGQIGDGTTTDRSTPIRLNLNGIVDIAAGIGSSYALAADGKLYSWGRNENGRLGTGNTTGRNSPGLVILPAGVKFVSVNARFATAGGITADGDVYTWGYGGYGTAGTGRGSDVLTPAKIDLSNIAYIELGYYNGAAVTQDGVLYTWGDNVNGQLGNGATMGAATTAPAIVPYFQGSGIKISTVSVGWYHMAAVSDSGQLFTWGYGAEGRLGNNQTASKNTPQQISLPFGVTKALAGYLHTSVLCENGTVYFFGQNLYGKHGSGNTTNHLTPYLLNGISNIIDISVGMDSSFVLVGGQIVYGMGYGGTGVFGTGNNSNSTTAVPWVFVPPPPQ